MHDSTHDIEREEQMSPLRPEFAPTMSRDDAVFAIASMLESDDDHSREERFDGGML